MARYKKPINAGRNLPRRLPRHLIMPQTLPTPTADQRQTMPDYRTPGVHIEETSFRSRPIAGVSTSTAGFVGPAHFGPMDGESELLTSFADFGRGCGGLDPLTVEGVPKHNYLAHAARAFFENGDTRLYVARVREGADAGEYAGTGGVNSKRKSGLKSFEDV